MANLGRLENRVDRNEATPRGGSAEKSNNRFGQFRQINRYAITRRYTDSNQRAGKAINLAGELCVGQAPVVLQQGWCRG